MLGLKRGTVQLFDHEKEWEIEAQNTICRLREILGDIIIDIQHIGSTSIKCIKAKPIIDIAVAVDNFADVLKREADMNKNGFYYCPCDDRDGQILFACGSYYDGTGDIQTHFIHIVLTGSMEWINYINFRNYLNNTPSVAKEYENLKLSLTAAAPVDDGREKYRKGKHDFIVYTLRKALVRSYLGKIVNIKIDRPLGYVHKKADCNIICELNYGYIPGIIGGDGEELDVYLMGVDEPVESYTCKIIGIIHRKDDIEDKLVAAPIGMNFHQAQIAESVHFTEQYFDSTVEAIYQKSCGVILYRKSNGATQYLLLFQNVSRTWSFPKGHMERGETEFDTAIREVYEETGIDIQNISDFRAETRYTIGGKIEKYVVLFAAETADEPKTTDLNEIQEMRWVTADEAIELLPKNYKNILKKVEEQIKNEC